MTDERKVVLEQLRDDHRDVLLEANRASRDFHHPWVVAPTDAAGFAAYRKRAASDDTAAFLAFTVDDHQLVGAINLNHITRRNFLNAHLGYYANVALAGQGFMTAAMRAVVREAFGELGLHRLEANIQPGNEPSRRLVERCGFRHEGLARRLIHIGGQWQDHDRYALTAEDVD